MFVLRSIKILIFAKNIRKTTLEHSKSRKSLIFSESQGASESQLAFCSELFFVFWNTTREALWDQRKIKNLLNELIYRCQTINAISRSRGSKLENHFKKNLCLKIDLTLRRPTCKSWHIKVSFSSHGSAWTAMSKLWKNIFFI